MLRTCSMVPFFCRNCSRAQAWCKFYCQAQRPKVLRTHGVLTVLTSKRAQAWCKFCQALLRKALRTCQLFTILTSKSLSRAGVVQILSTSRAADAPHHLAFRTCLSEPPKPRNYGKTQHFAQFLPAKISPVSHLCFKTSLLFNIDAATPSGNFQYSRKLELPNFL